MIFKPKKRAKLQNICGNAKKIIKNTANIEIFLYLCVGKVFSN